MDAVDFFLPRLFDRDLPFSSPELVGLFAPMALSGDVVRFLPRLVDRDLFALFTNNESRSELEVVDVSSDRRSMLRQLPLLRILVCSRVFVCALLFSLALFLTV